MQIEDAILTCKEGTALNDDIWVNVLNYINDDNRTTILGSTLQHHTIRKALQTLELNGVRSVVRTAAQAAAMRSILGADVKLAVNRIVLWPLLLRRIKVPCQFLMLNYWKTLARTLRQLTSMPPARWTWSTQAELESVIADIHNYRDKLVSVYGIDD